MYVMLCYVYDFMYTVLHIYLCIYVCITLLDRYGFIPAMGLPPPFVVCGWGSWLCNGAGILVTAVTFIKNL